MPNTKIDPETIAEKASELFVRHGYSSTSMAEIGESCGVGKGGINNHFENKEKLLLYILKRLQSDLDSYVFSIADDREQTARERLQAINSFLKDYFLTKKACLIAVMGMSSEIISEEARNIMQRIFMDWKETYVKLFSSQHSTYIAEIHATNSIMFIEGAVVWMRVTQEADPLTRVFTDIDNLLQAENNHAMT